MRQCFDVLELDSNASIDEARQAYKDMVNIWHPDRFSNNPRLKQKAEDKLKEINEAYEMMQSFLYSKKPLEPEKAPHPKGNSGADISANASSRAGYRKSHAETGTKDKTEAFFEAGTGIVLSLFSYLSSAVRRIITEAKTEIGQGKSNQSQKSDDMRGKGRGRGMRGGKRMGRGGRGGGRGRGM
ncbi:MAG: DnaJ domain-containing protein [Deltaproteobacteria bacterium]|nr:DnaJ domain-containing protein [Deltaproteobacteria bacterium]